MFSHICARMQFCNFTHVIFNCVEPLLKGTQPDSVYGESDIIYCQYAMDMLKTFQPRNTNINQPCSSCVSVEKCTKNYKNCI